VLVSGFIVVISLEMPHSRNKTKEEQGYRLWMKANKKAIQRELSVAVTVLLAYKSTFILSYYILYIY